MRTSAPAQPDSVDDLGVRLTGKFRGKGPVVFDEDFRAHSLPAERKGVCMDYRNAFDLTGSVAVITGGSRGIGFESAVALGSFGAKIVLAARDRSALDAADGGYTAW
jgi:hypothetical protein